MKQYSKTIFPLKFRQFSADRILFANDAGDTFISNDSFLTRYANGVTTESDDAFLRLHGFSFEDNNDYALKSYLERFTLSLNRAEEVSYVIVVPTLRCNLKCSYCQVSRASESAQGYDWTDKTLGAFKEYLETLTTNDIKIEFQGGEPLLRVDLLEEVRAHCQKQFDNVQLVVCTNLQVLSLESERFLAHEEVSISTSFDGSERIHRINRTGSESSNVQFFDNFKKIIETYGTDKVSALPTIDYASSPSSVDIIEAYRDMGFPSIYLRPVNYQGFARKQFPHAKTGVDQWLKVYFEYLEYIIETNYEKANFIEEFYFSYCLKRMFATNPQSHVDLRNPNHVGKDYIVVDYDGSFYPTDEARMLARIGQIDLRIGDVFSGIDQAKVEQLNHHGVNNFNEACIDCVYQSACGVDLVDDLSRYGSIDVRKTDTWFCKYHMALFDKIVEYSTSDRPEVHYSINRWLGAQSAKPLSLVSQHYAT